MHMFKRFFAAAVALTATGLMTAGCATEPVGGPYVGPEEVGRAHHTELGTIVSAHDVLVHSDGRGGAVVGAVAGGATGAALGGDTGGSIAGGLAGALIGSILGSEIERSSSAHEGVEYVIDLDNGRTITVVQDRSRYIEPGTRVRVIFGEYVRVIPVRGGEGHRRGRHDEGGTGEWQDDEGAYDEGDDGR